MNTSGDFRCPSCRRDVSESEMIELGLDPRNNRLFVDIDEFLRTIRDFIWNQRNHQSFYNILRTPDIFFMMHAQARYQLQTITNVDQLDDPTLTEMYNVSLNRYSLSSNFDDFQLITLKWKYMAEWLYHTLESRGLNPQALPFRLYSRSSIVCGVM